VRLRPVLGFAILAIGLAASRDALADAGADLEKAHNAYVAHQYDEAESRLGALLGPATGALRDPDSIADARMYLGATFVAEKRFDEAAAVFVWLLSDKPEYQPDPLRVSLEAMDRFTDAKTHHRETLAAVQAERVRKAQEEKAKANLERQKAAVRLAMLERLAGTEVVTTQNSRLIALIPFGAGQFQNGQTALAWTFLVSEGLLAIGSGIGAAVWSYNLSQVDSNYSAGNGSVAQQYNYRAQTAAVVGDFLAGGFFAVALVGIIHAEATFVPETTTTRARAIPPVSVRPVVGPGGVGLVGSF
jgi:hypothetical protein